MEDCVGAGDGGEGVLGIAGFFSLVVGVVVVAVFNFRV